MNPNRGIDSMRVVLIGVWIVLFTGNGIVWGEPSSVLEVGRFSTEKAGNGLPARWEPLDFKRIKTHTHYRLVEADGQVVVQAKADTSASGLILRISIEPKEYPIVQWRWKVSNMLQKGNVHRKDGDD